MEQVILGLARCTHLANDIRRDVFIVLMVGLGAYFSIALFYSSLIFPVSHKALMLRWWLSNIIVEVF